MKYATLLLGLALVLAAIATARAQVQPGPNLTPNGIPYTYSPRYGVFPRRPPSSPRLLVPPPSLPIEPAMIAPPPPPDVAPPPPPPPELAPPPPQPLGWVYTRYTVCPEPRSCPVVFVSVAADGLNVRAVPEGPATMALVNGTPLVVLDRQGSWSLVAPACDLTPTFLWSWTANVPLNRCWVY